jgi:hypothetical protein
VRAGITGRRFYGVTASIRCSSRTNGSASGGPIRTQTCATSPERPEKVAGFLTFASSDPQKPAGAGSSSNLNGIARCGRVDLEEPEPHRAVGGDGRFRMDARPSIPRRPTNRYPRRGTASTESGSSTSSPSAAQACFTPFFTACSKSSAGARASPDRYVADFSRRDLR